MKKLLLTKPQELKVWTGFESTKTFLLKTALLFLATFTVGFSVYATTYTYVSGAPTTASNWKNGGTGATNFTTAGDIFIVPVGVSTTATSGTFNFGNSSTSSLVLLQVDGTLNLGASGGLVVAGGSKIQITNGGIVNGTAGPIVINTTSGIFQIDNGGTYNHGVTTAISGAFTGTEIFGASSNFNVTAQSSITALAVVSAPGFGNFTYTGGGAMQCNGSFANVQGTLTVSSSSLRFNSSTTGTSTSVTINNLTINSVGVLDFGNGSVNGYTVNVIGDVNITSTATNPIAFSANTGTSGTHNTANLNFAKAGTQTFSTTSTALIVSATSSFRDFNITVNSGATLDLGTSVLQTPASSTVNFTVAAGGGLITKNAAGITSGNTASGSIQTGGGTRTYGVGNYTYNATATTQVTGSGLPATVANLTINNTGGTTGVTLSNSVAVNTLLTLTAGRLTTGANTVTVSSTSGLSTGGATNYVSGTLIRAVAAGASGPIAFPIGTATAYAPVSLTFAAGTAAGNVTASTSVPGVPPAAGSIPTGSGISQTNYINRNWTLAFSAATNYTATLTYINPTDVVGTPTLTALRVGFNNAGTWSNPTGSSASPTATTAAGITSGGIFSLGDVAAAVPTITPASNTFTAFTTTFGTASAAQTVAVTGSNLTADISVAAGTGFEVSNGGAFGPSTSFTQTAGNASGTLSVRLAANASAGGSYNAVTAATLTSTGATTATYTTSATGNSVAKATPTATLNVTNTPQTYTGAGQSATVGIVSSSVPGAVSNISTGGAATQTNAGSYAVTADFVPTDAVNYNTLTGLSAGSFVISKATPTATLNVTNTPQPYTGAGQSATVGVVTSSTPGSTSNISTGGAATQTNAGSYAVTADFVPTDAVNYNTLTGLSAGSFVISPLSVVVTPDAGQSKAFGAANPTYTYAFAPALISPDVITGLLGRTAGEAVGTYAYNIGTLTAGANYSLSIGGSNTFQIVAIGQGTADFRSKASGNFTSMSGVWEYDQGGGVFVAATQAPLSTNSVSITHSITLDQDYTVGAGKTFVLGTGGTLSVSAGRTLSVAGSANFGGNAVTFVSNASGTASLGEVSGTLSGATNVTVERYIPDNGFRSWRLLSVPVTTAQTIRQAWQEGDANPNAKDNNLPNRGTQITGVFNTQAAAAAAGFDSTSVNAAMLRWSGSAWANITSTNQPLNSFSSYFLYIRGERSLSVTGAVSNSSATTLRAKGTVFTGDQANSIGANAFGLVPNLYPSAVNFTGLTRTGGVSNLFYIWDSKKLSGNSLGVYQTFSGTNSFNCLVGGGSYVLGQPNTTIESGQSFFVTSGAAGTITLRESAKISGTNGSLGFRPAAQSKIGTRLYNSAGEMLDANTVVFDAGYAREVAAEDAPKLGNPGANFAIETGGKLLAVEGTQPVKEGDAIQFRMWNLAQGTYSLEVEPKSFSLPEGVTAILEDSYLKTNTAINLAATNKLAFAVNQDARSSSANRFKIMFVKAEPAATNSKPSYTIAPNPVEGSAMNLQLGSQPAGRYAVRIVGAGGQAVYSGTISHAGGTAAQSISLPAGLAAGTYTVEIVAPSKTRSTQTVLINRK